MKFDVLKVLGFIVVLIGLSLEAICIFGLIKEGLIPGNTKAIIGWSVGAAAFIPAIICLFKLFFSILDDDN